MQKIYVYLATLGPVGKLPIAPGTWGSAVACLIWWFLLFKFDVIYQWITIAVIAILAVLIASKAEQSLGRDARPIIIDEVVGQWIPLAFCDRNIVSVVISFLLFRFFDVLKPFPVNHSQKIKGGTGVVIDDLLAGGYATLALIIIQRLGIV